MFLPMKDIQPFFEKKGFDYKKSFKKPLAEMAYIDYVTGNTDRHLGNYGFLIDADTNKLLGFAPLFDFNVSMNITAKHLNTRLHTELYYPTNKSILESAVDAMSVLGDSVPMEYNNAPDYVNERLNILKANVKSKYVSMCTNPFEKKINALIKKSGKSKDDFIKYYSSTVTDNIMQQYPYISDTDMNRAYVGYCLLEGIEPQNQS